MKKPALIFFGILLVILIGIYFIIPQKIVTTHNVEVGTIDLNVAKFLVYKKTWSKWWPGQHNSSQPDLYTYNGIEFLLQKNTNAQIDVVIDPKGINLPGTITYLATSDDVCKVTWVTETLSQLNPVSRVTEYLKIKSATKNIDAILARFKSFMQQDSNIYGITVVAEKIKFPIVVAKTTNTSTYPTVKTVYSLIADLKKQVQQQQALELDSPMLNIHQMEKGFQVMVAIPINKLITPAKGSVINKLPKGGNLLSARVKGGFKTVNDAFTQLKNFQTDKGLKSPAMPYASLLTNRLAEPDSGKWITKIYYPSY
ncbi:hypothetical protein ACFQZI_04530 [Mucilaginibacter lutimaris]|uniref:GyrI-like small molecule binding domain-containing protein n=1 Tax=Mucilaginibacter lutimaris TaxID=931629 RepID=A0ABW2ZD48_9SPHI